MRRPHEVIIVEDDPLQLIALHQTLSQDYTVHRCLHPGRAEKILQTRAIPILILDLNLQPETNTILLIKEWKTRYPDTDIVVYSGEKQLEKAVLCLKEGAKDYLVKPLSADILKNKIRKVLETREGESYQKPEIPLVGNSLKPLLEKLSKLRNHSELSILIQGESGTGKEMIARFLHAQESNPKRPFVVANLAAIPISLIESELFGVEKGAYTDAKISRSGKLELANGGDLFLDEIGELPIELQPKLLRTLQDKKIERMGSTEQKQLHYRIISATNQALDELVRSTKFRLDLYYRLADVVISVPPLRERKEDILELIHFFLKKYSPAEYPIEIHPALEKKLLRYDWPGNIRELESTIKRGILFSENRVIEEVDFYTVQNSPVPPRFETGAPYDELLKKYERFLLEDALRKNNGSHLLARKDLGLKKGTYYRKWKILNGGTIKPNGFSHSAHS
jgi:DNA-binding NtrC family response regulator